MTNATRTNAEKALKSYPHLAKLSLLELRNEFRRIRDTIRTFEEDGEDTGSLVEEIWAVEQVGKTRAA